MPAQVTPHNERSAGSAAVAIVAGSYDPQPVTVAGRRKPQLNARYRPAARQAARR